MSTDESTDLRDIFACAYCRHASYPRGDGPYCTNKESPFYVHGNLAGTFLQIEQALPGCGQINRSPLFKKIPPEIFRQTPSDSQLRTLPLELNVEDTSSDFSNDQTTQDILEARGLLTK